MDVLIEFAPKLTSTLSRSEINFCLYLVIFKDRAFVVEDTTEDSVLNVDNTGIVEATVETILIDDSLTIVDSVTDEDNIDKSVQIVDTFTVEDNIDNSVTVETIVIDDSVTIVETVTVEDNIDDSVKIVDTVTVEDNIDDSVTIVDSVMVDDTLNTTADSYTSDRSRSRKYMSECPIHNHHMDGTWESICPDDGPCNCM